MAVKPKSADDYVGRANKRPLCCEAQLARCSQMPIHAHCYRRSIFTSKVGEGDRLVVCDSPGLCVCKTTSLCVQRLRLVSR